MDVQLPDEDEEVAAPAKRLIEDIPDPSKQDGLVAWANLGTLTQSRSKAVFASNASGTHVVESAFTVDVNQSFLSDVVRRLTSFARS